MDELQALLGDSYKEGMTVEEIGAFFKGKNFKDLSTGNYVDKSKFDNKVNELTQQLSDKDKELNAKLSDDEKKQKSYDSQAKEIARLQNLLKENTINGNKSIIEGTMTSSKQLLSITDTDTDYTAFIDNIVSEDSSKSKSIATYVAKLVKDSYEKGKQDATKDSMGAFGKQAGDNNNSGKDPLSDLAVTIAKARGDSKPSYDYFKK